MARKIKKYKVGLDSETMAISLVTEPAIEVDFIHMSKDEEEKQQVFLEKNEKYLVYGPALIISECEGAFYFNMTFPSCFLFSTA